MYEPMDACNARFFDTTLNCRKQAVSDKPQIYCISPIQIPDDTLFSNSTLSICQISNYHQYQQPYCNSLIGSGVRIASDTNLHFTSNAPTSYDSYNIGFPQVLDYQVDENQENNSLDYQYNSIIDPQGSLYFQGLDFSSPSHTSINIINQPFTAHQQVDSNNISSDSSPNEEIFASVINDHSYDENEEKPDYQQQFSNLNMDLYLFSPKNQIYSMQIDSQPNNSTDFVVDNSNVSKQKPKIQENKKSNSTNSIECIKQTTEQPSQNEKKTRYIAHNFRTRKVSSSPSLGKLPPRNNHNADIEFDKKPIVNYQKPSYLTTKSNSKEDAKGCDKNDVKNDNKKFDTSVKSRIRGRR